MSTTSETLVIGGDVADVMNKLKQLEAQLKRTEGGVKSMGATARASGGHGALGFLELARGAEDFASQIHLGVGPAMRASVNNISSMATMMGGPLVGAVGTFGAIAAGVLIPRLFATKDATKEVDEHFKRMQETIQKTNDTIDKFFGRGDEMKERATRAAEDEAMQTKEGEVGAAMTKRDKARAALNKQLEEDKRESDQDRSFFGGDTEEFAKRERERARKRNPLEVAAAMAENAVRDAVGGRDQLKKSIDMRRSIGGFEQVKKRVAPEVEKLGDILGGKGPDVETDTKEMRRARDSIEGIDRQLREVDRGEKTGAIGKREAKRRRDALEVQKSEQQDVIADEKNKADDAKRQRDDTNKLLKDIKDALTGGGASQAASSAGKVIPALNRAAGLFGL